MSFFIIKLFTEISSLSIKYQYIYVDNRLMDTMDLARRLSSKPELDLLFFLKNVGKRYCNYINDDKICKYNGNSYGVAWELLDN